MSAISPVNIQIIKTPQQNGPDLYEIDFYPQPKDPQPEIYHRRKKPGSSTLPREVQWNLVPQVANAPPLDADKFVLIVPKAYNSQIFYNHVVAKPAEERRLDNNVLSVLSGEAMRGPGMGPVFGWYYEIQLLGSNREEAIVTFPPTPPRGTNYVIAYLDPVVVIKEEP